MSQINDAVLYSLKWMTTHFAEVERTMGVPPEAYSVELKAAIAQCDLLEAGVIQVIEILPDGAESESEKCQSTE